MPSYRTATAAHALGVTAKWLDNLLSHNKIAGVASERQGSARRLSTESVATIELTRELVDSLQLPVVAAVSLAHSLLANSGHSAHASPYLTISLNRPALFEHVLGQLAHAVEVSPTPRRGRPPGR